MTEIADPLSLLEKIRNGLTGYKARVATLIHQIVVGTLFLLAKIDWITINPDAETGLSIFFVSNAIGLAFVILRRDLSKPRAVGWECPSCHFRMTPTSMKCESCGGVFSVGGTQ